MDNSVLDYPWAEYASLQERSDQIKKLGHTAWAIEDQLNTFLESFAEGSLPNDNDALEKRLSNLLINRHKKHRNRLRLLQKQAATAPTSSSPETVILNLIQAEQLVQIRALTTMQELRILQGLALDLDYKTVAQSEGMSVASLKTKVCRCRHRLRIRLAA